jgi:hypothetical protein
MQQNGRASRWKEVTGSNPCPVCQHKSWCRITDDGSLCACRRSAAGGERRTDKSGAEYYLHRLKPSTNGEKWEEPKYSLVDCPKDEEGNPIPANADTRHEIYKRLMDNCHNIPNGSLPVHSEQWKGTVAENSSP